MRRIALFFTMALVCVELCAQTFDESMKYWSEGALTWDDLTLKSPKDIFRTNDLSFRWITENKKTKPYWNTVQYVSTPATALDKSVSWHNSARVYDYTLLYDQTIFDMNELYHRKMMGELYAKDNRRTPDELYSFYSNQLRSRWQELDDDTEGGMDSLAVVTFAEKIKDELAEVKYPEYDERRYVNGSKLIQAYLDFGFGASCNIMTGDWASTFPTAFGMYMDFSLGYLKHIVTVAMSPSSGTLGTDFSHDGYQWLQGEGFNHLMIGFAYGYMLYDGPFFALIPRAGIGGREFSWSRGTGNNMLKDDFSNTVALAGAEFRFKFHRVLSQYTSHEHSLAIRCLAARDFGIMDAFSFNITLGYVWSIK